MWRTEDSTLRPLLKLSGMSLHGGKTAQHWITLVGVDPRTVPGVKVTALGECYWTDAAEKRCRAHWDARRGNLAALGIVTG